MNKLSRILLSMVLLIAGLLHIIRPELFNPAIPFGNKLFINLIVGVFESFLALGLLSRRFQDQSAKIAALWFLLLMPIHIYVSWNQVSIFSINNPILLWIRTFMQPFLYFWALSLQTKGWIMSQTWRDVLFLHYTVSPEELQKHVPFELDLYNGHAVVSVVSFTMQSIRFPFLPVVPGLSKLNELNLRTYVEVDGIKGVYFFTLDADLRPAIWIARTFFSLPYRLAKILIGIKDSSYVCESKNSLSSLLIHAEIGPSRVSNEFDLWATERYGLFTRSNKDSLHGIVLHIPWKLKDATLKTIDDEFTSHLGIHLKAENFINPSYCQELKVKFRPFYKLSIGHTT